MQNKIDFRLASVLFLIVAIGLRVAPHNYNVAAIGALGLFVGCYWSLRMGLLFTLAAMTVSDVIGHFAGVPSMGAYSPWLMVAVYGAMACSAVLGKGIKLSQAPKLFGVPTGAVLSSVVFFLITNFASWALMPEVYARSLNGLMESYVAAIPFAQNTFLGNVFFSIAFFGIYAVLAQPNRVHETIKVTTGTKVTEVKN